MYVIRLPSGNLLVPEAVLASEGQLVGDAYVEVGPADPDYERLAASALTEDQMAERKQHWRDGDEALRKQFLDYLASGGEPGGGEPGGGEPTGA